MIHTSFSTWVNLCEKYFLTWVLLTTGFSSGGKLVAHGFLFCSCHVLRFTNVVLMLLGLPLLQGYVFWFEDLAFQCITACGFELARPYPGVPLFWGVVWLGSFISVFWFPRVFLVLSRCRVIGFLMFSLGFLSFVWPR